MEGKGGEGGGTADSPVRPPCCRCAMITEAGASSLVPSRPAPPQLAALESLARSAIGSSVRRQIRRIRLEIAASLSTDHHDAAGDGSGASAAHSPVLPPGGAALLEAGLAELASQLADLAELEAQMAVCFGPAWRVECGPNLAARSCGGLCECRAPAALIGARRRLHCTLDGCGVWWWCGWRMGGDGEAILRIALCRSRYSEWEVGGRGLEGEGSEVGSRVEDGGEWWWIGEGR